MQQGAAKAPVRWQLSQPAMPPPKSRWSGQEAHLWRADVCCQSSAAQHLPITITSAAAFMDLSSRQLSTPTPLRTQPLCVTPVPHLCDSWFDLLSLEAPVPAAQQCAFSHLVTHYAPHKQTYAHTLSLCSLPCPTCSLHSPSSPHTSSLKSPPLTHRCPACRAVRCRRGSELPAPFVDHHTGRAQHHQAATAG